MAIGLITAVAAQIYWSVFLDDFRVSLAVVLLPVLMMTLGKQLRTLTICTVTACTVFLFRCIVDASQVETVGELVAANLPGALFYVWYGFIFKILIRNKHVVAFGNLMMAVFVCDFAANVIELMFREAILGGKLDQDILQKLCLIALVRTFFAAFLLICERQYRTLLKKTEHEDRYQRLFLMTTGLKSEIYLMHKNTEEIERVMSNAYRLYERILEMELPAEMQQMGLEIARDVHEIKKDYIRIIQGIEQAIDEDYDEAKMSFQDMLQILEASTYHILDEKRLDVNLQFDCQDDFITKGHYLLMAMLKNLVSNAIEAIESKKHGGSIRISEKKQNGSYVFEVSDDGPGIAEKHLPRIFDMGFSTKFDEKTGNIYRGVGLCGVKKTVEEQFKGSITVESEAGKGTRFRIEIPVEILEEA